MMLRLSSKFYVNDDAISGGNLSVDDTLEILNDTDDSDKIDLEPVKKSKVQDDDTTEELEDEEEIIDDKDKDLDDLEEELSDDEPDDEKLELVTPVRRQEILKKYPELFKDFPYLERAYYREQAYTELLPTINDAKEAVEKSKALDNFEADLIKGNTEQILKAVKSEDENAFLKIVDDYLPTLAKVDEKAYFHVLGGVIKKTIIAMAREAQKLGTGDGQPGTTLQAAAHILNQFTFGTSEFEPEKKLAQEIKEPDQQLSDKEAQFNQRRFESARNDLGSRVSNSLKSTIENYIDPKDSMTSYVKTNAIRDALDQTNNIIGKDSRFKAILDRLWMDAAKNDYSTESVNKIRSAVLTRAKHVLPDVIKKVRNDALKGLGKKNKPELADEDESDETPVVKNKNTRNSTSSNKKSSGNNDKQRRLPRGMSTLDFLNSD